MSPSLPVVGAAMRSDMLKQYVSWLIADQRDLEIQDPAWPGFPDLDWQARVKEIRSLLDGYTGRMGVHGPFLGVPLAAFDTKIRQAVSDRLVQTLDICAELGATHMVVHSPLEFLGTPFAPLTPSPMGIDLLGIIQETLREAVTHAEKIGCTIVIENIFDQNPDYWVAMAKSFNSEFVRSSLDTGHAYVNHKISAPPPDYWVRTAGTMLGHIHLQDTDGYADRHWLPGEGLINWKSLFDAISKLEQKPRLILELADQTAICDAAEWLTQRGLAR
jgi:sugar phosphate isomerase/epimerase